MSAPMLPRDASPAATSDLFNVLFDGPDVRTEVVSTGRLRPVGERPSLNEYTRQLWQRRHFLVAEARAKVTAGTRETLLGTAWLILKPVLDGLTYYLVFGLLLQTDRGIRNFLGYLVIGVFMFSFTSRCVTGGAQSIATGRNMIRAFAFPRASLPIAVILRELINMVWVFLAMIVLIYSLPEPEITTWRVTLVPLIFALQVIFCTGLALLLARWTAAVPDVKVIVQFAMRLWLYGSAVFFSYDRFLSHPTVLNLMEANPMFRVLDMTRDCMLYGVTPDTTSWLVLGSWAFGMLAVGYVVFWRAEESYGRA
ncbi:teichoic acid transport system permease protein [Paraoerskovia marina]|uniref:Transport permease protein n=1 Tax=Paraoerskovia marina TaxID=545619 RepID=A0A1H1Q7X7_9CELL|nr:ABC transporter permease [Paraoerskovia marina]SDS19423.1 teichoic acid transport system permease protein [Paraoerskovia marina]